MTLVGEPMWIRIFVGTVLGLLILLIARLVIEWPVEDSKEG